MAQLYVVIFTSFAKKKQKYVLTVRITEFSLKLCFLVFVVFPCFTSHFRGSYELCKHAYGFYSSRLLACYETCNLEGQVYFCTGCHYFSKGPRFHGMVLLPKDIPSYVGKDTKTLDENCKSALYTRKTRRTQVYGANNWTACQTRDYQWRP